MRPNNRFRGRLPWFAAAAVLSLLAGCEGSPGATPPEVLSFSRGSRLDIENTAMVNNNDAYFARRAFINLGILLP